MGSTPNTPFELTATQKIQAPEIKGFLEPRQTSGQKCGAVWSPAVILALVKNLGTLIRQKIGNLRGYFVYRKISLFTVSFLVKKDIIFGVQDQKFFRAFVCFPPLIIALVFPSPFWTPRSLNMPIWGQVRSRILQHKKNTNGNREHGEGWDY